MGDMLVLMVGCGTWTVCGLGPQALGWVLLGWGTRTRTRRCWVEGMRVRMRMWMDWDRGG